MPRYRSGSEHDRVLFHHVVNLGDGSRLIELEVGDSVGHLFDIAISRLIENENFGRFWMPPFSSGSPSAGEATNPFASANIPNVVQEANA